MVRIHARLEATRSAIGHDALGKDSPDTVRKTEAGSMAISAIDGLKVGTRVAWYMGIGTRH